MTNLNTLSFSDFVKLGEVMWVKGMESVSMETKNSGIFKVMNIPKHTGNTREFSEIDLNEYASKKNQGDDATRSKVQQGYTKTMTKYRIANELPITKEMRDENKYPEVVSQLTSLSSQIYKRMELDLALRVSFMAAVSYTDMDGDTVDTTVGDGFQLAYTAHTLKGSSTTYRNILANNPRLSKGALEGIEALGKTEMYNQFGENKVMTFDILWTTDEPNAVNTAREYLQSTADVEGANAGVINSYKSKYRHVVLPRADMTAAGVKDSTKKYFWGLVSSAYSTAYLGIWEAPHLKVSTEGGNAEDFSSDDLLFGARGGYGIVTVTANWFLASKGDGTA